MWTTTWKYTQISLKNLKMVPSLDTRWESNLSPSYPFLQIVTIQMSLLSIFIIERKQDLTYFLKFCISMNSIIWLNFLYKFFRMTKHIKLYVKIKNIFSFRLALALKMDGKIAYLLCSTNATTIPVNQVPLLILF